MAHRTHPHDRFRVVGDQHILQSLGDPMLAVVAIKRRVKAAEE